MAKRVDQHYNQLHTLKAGFTEQFDGLGMHRVDSGTLLLEKPGKMRWDYQSTAGKLFVLDGKFAWFYTPGDSQVQRIAASQLDDLRSPLRFLLGHTKLENELTGLTLSADKAGIVTLAGVPKGQEKRVTKLSITATAGGAILSILIEEGDGARTSFVFSNEEVNPAIPESAFHFAPPAGVPVVDSLPPV
jgi:outer membrane lipoprotein carrier protein